MRGTDKPQDAYAAVAFIMFLVTLSNEGGNERLPVLTIPTG